MSKGPWKPETKQKHKAPPRRHSRPPVKPPEGDEPVHHGEPVDNSSASHIKPLPLFAGGDAPLPGGEDAPAGDADPAAPAFDEAKIKAGIGKVFCTTVAGVASMLNHALRNSAYQVHFEPVEPEMGELWAEFAFPVLKMHMPDLEKNPHMTLVTMTIFILSGKIRVTRKEVKPNDAANGNA